MNTQRYDHVNNLNIETFQFYCKLQKQNKQKKRKREKENHKRVESNGMNRVHENEMKRIETK